MFGHIYIYRLKCLLRDKETIFWTLMFPLLLATFFYMAFSNLNSGETFRAIDIAVVENAQYQDDLYFKLALKGASKGENRLFNLKAVTTEEEAQKKLNNNLIAGYVVAETPIRLVVKKSGIYQNITKSFIDNYIQTASAVGNILSGGIDKPEDLFASIGDRKQYIQEVSLTSVKPNNVLNYFYTLIAMACFYGSFFGMREITDIQANISAVAARVNVAPVHKLKTLIYSSTASLSIQFTQLLILLLYLRYVLQVDFGTKTGYVVLTTFIGSIIGIMYGALISALMKKSEGMKIALIIGTSMVGSFLAGMMYQNMKYIVAEHVPLLSYLNPINLLTDAYYCLYYYDSLSRYGLNMGLLCIFIGVFCLSTYFIIRRRKYASL